jgi:hypothetical protein
MPDRWSATAYASLMVALYVAEPSQVELTVHDHVRIERVTDTGRRTPRCTCAARYHIGVPDQEHLRLPHHPGCAGAARRWRTFSAFRYLRSERKAFLAAGTESGEHRRSVHPVQAPRWWSWRLCRHH